MSSYYFNRYSSQDGEGGYEICSYLSPSYTQPTTALHLHRNEYDHKRVDQLHVQ